MAHEGEESSSNSVHETRPCGFVILMLQWATKKQKVVADGSNSSIRDLLSA